MPIVGLDMLSAVLRMFVVYLLVETAALAALIWAIGFGWAVLVLLGVFAAGLALAGSQARRQLIRLSRTGPRRGVVADGALVALGTGLVVVPGLVTTAFGVLLLLPATRSAARPVLTALAVAGLGRRAPLIAAATAGQRWYSTRSAERRDFIDAEFVDVTEFTDVTPATRVTDPGQAALSVGGFRGTATP